jgi:hypothetical protein
MFFISPVCGDIKARYPKGVSGGIWYVPNTAVDLARVYRQQQQQQQQR